MKPKRKSNTLPLLFVALGGLLLAAAAFWLVSQNFAGTPEPTVQIPASVDEVQRVSLKDAYAAYMAGTAIILDVRGTESYAAGHIPGSLNIPEAELPTRMGELSQDDWILIVCT